MSACLWCVGLREPVPVPEPEPEPVLWGRLENSLRGLLPAIEGIVDMYQEKVEEFGRITTALTAVNLALNTLLCLGVAWSCLKALLNLVQLLQYRYVCCTLAIALPSDSVKVVLVTPAAPLELEVARQRERGGEGGGEQQRASERVRERERTERGGNRQRGRERGKERGKESGSERERESAAAREREERVREEA